MLGGALDISAPLGHATAESSYIGNASPVTVGLRGIFDGQAGPLSFGANLRGVYRKDARSARPRSGPEFRYGAGVGYRISPVFRVLAEGYGGTRFSSKSGTNSLEIDGAVQIEPLDVGLHLHGRRRRRRPPGRRRPGGARNRRHPLLARGRRSGRRRHQRHRRQVPDIAEDKDGFEDEDGCPDDDNDR